MKAVLDSRRITVPVYSLFRKEERIIVIENNENSVEKLN